MCALIAVNMILLLCAAWVVFYAGIIFLGFGGCRWTSDMAINYYRTVLGVGVSLMTMQLIIGIGIKFLQDLVASTGQNSDAPMLWRLLWLRPSSCWSSRIGSRKWWRAWWWAAAITARSAVSG